MWCGKSQRLDSILGVWQGDELTRLCRLSTRLDSRRQGVKSRLAESMNCPALKEVTTTASGSMLSIRVRAIR